MPDSFLVTDKRSKLLQDKAGRIRFNDPAPWRSYDRQVDEQIAPGIGAGRARAARGGGIEIEASAETLERAEEAQQLEERERQALPVSDRLPTPELADALAELKEENIAKVKHNRMEGQDELTEAYEGMRCVNPMWTTDFGEKLGRMGLRYRFAPHAWPGCVTLVVEYPELLAKPAFKIYCQAPAMYEWSTLRIDEHGLRAGWKYRGWRQILSALVYAGLLQEGQALGAFGEVRGEAGQQWRREMYGWRNRPERS